MKKYIFKFISFYFCLLFIYCWQQKYINLYTTKSSYVQINTRTNSVWPLNWKSWKIILIFNHLTAKAPLLSSPNIHFLQRIFEIISLECYKQRDTNWIRLFWLWHYSHTYSIRWNNIISVGRQNNITWLLVSAFFKNKTWSCLTKKELA